MICEKCGKEINNVLVLRFNYDGSDNWRKVEIIETEEAEAVVMDLDHNWTGYELTEEEQMETIQCPHCEQFPFKHEEVQCYEIVRVVCFKTDNPTEKGGGE